MTTTAPDRLMTSELTRRAAEVHTSSHRHLLVDPDAGLRLISGLTVDRMDAVVVPTRRRRPDLTFALAQARRQQCPLVLLCSGPAALERLHRQLSRVAGVDVVLVDVESAAEATGRRYGDLGLALATDTCRPSNRDTGYKRNVGLLLARAQGWRKILFLDDDVRGLPQEELAQAAGLLDGGQLRAVGWRCTAFADNSAVCHAYRQAGGRQDVFIGGGGLLVAVDDETPFFPEVYNEDWLFFLPMLFRRQVALGGRSFQLPFDPYRERPAQQEFGDVLGETLLRRLGGGARDGRELTEILEPATRAPWWESAIRDRSAFLGLIALDLDPSQSQARAAVNAAGTALSGLTPESFVTFTKGLIADQTAWHRALRQVAGRSTNGATDVLRGLGFEARSGRRRTLMSSSRWQPAGCRSNPRIRLA